MRPPTWLARNASRIARCAPGSSGHVITWRSSGNRAPDGEHETGQKAPNTKTMPRATVRRCREVWIWCPAPAAGGEENLPGKQYGKAGQDKAEHPQSTDAWLQIFPKYYEALISCTAVRTTAHCLAPRTW
jgi:hypothetical protein